MELVSVILPAYNAARFISDALESVLAQTYENIEIIVVNDGSTDETEKIVFNYEGIRYFRQHNRGASSARNKGIREAKGKYITFIDADDLWLPNKIKLQVNFLHQTGLKWCYCDSYYSWYEKKEVIGRLSGTQGIYHSDILIPYISNQFGIPVPSAMICRDVFDSIGFFDESLWTVEDTDLWLRIAVKFPVGYVDEPLVNIRKRLDSLSKMTPPAITGKNRRKVLKKLISIAPERLNPKYKELQAISYRYEGSHFLRYGQIAEARACFEKAIRLQPTKIPLYLFWTACWFKPIIKLFYKSRWFLLHDRKANLRSSWWIHEKEKSNRQLDQDKPGKL